MSDGKGLSVGWASRDITPDRPVNLLGQFHMRISKGVQDPVTATALSVSSDDDAFIWISCDLCAVPDVVLATCREKLKRLAPDFPSEKLVMSATHTHTAPDLPGSWYPLPPAGVMTPAEYGDLLAERAAEAAAESWNSRKAGAVGWGYGHAVVAHNRRAVYFDDLSLRPGYVDQPGTKTERNARMYGDTSDPQFSHLEGYVDHGVNLLYTFDAKRRLTGAVCCLPCPSQETEGMEMISADFWHETRVELRKRHGEKLFLLPQCAPSGDLSPHLMYDKKAEQRMLELKERTSRQEIAVRLADAFDETLQWARNDIRAEAPLRHAVRHITLPRRMISEAERCSAQAGLAALERKPGDQPTGAWLERDDVRFARSLRCRRIIERFEEQKHNPGFPMELHAIRLGDVAFATNPFELFLDYGLRITARSPALQTFLAQLAAGGNASYLATRRAVEGESYSACLYCNEVGPEGGQVLVEKTLELLRGLWPEASQKSK